MKEYEAKKHHHKVKDHSFTMDNIYTGTSDTFEDANPQQELVIVPLFGSQSAFDGS